MSDRADVPDVIALMDAAYTAALDPSCWTTLVERIAARLGGLAVLCVRDADRLSLVLTWAVVKGTVPEPLLGDPALRAWMGRAPDATSATTSGRSLLDAASDEAREWRRPLVRARGCLHATTPLLREDVLQSTLTVVRPDDAPFTPGERALLEAIAPHLRRAVRIAHRLHALSPLEGDAELALDRLRMGVLVLDADLNVLIANQTARSILDAGSGVRQVRGKLVIAERAVQESLVRFVKTCGGGTEPKSEAGSGTLAVHGPLGRSLSLLVAPMGERRTRGGAAPPERSVVFISDPDASVDTPDGVFESMFELTSAQARVAVLLMQGNSAEQCAQSLGCSLSTVRSHLKRVFEKTGTTRQSELVKLLLGSPTVAHHRVRAPGSPARAKA